MIENRLLNYRFSRDNILTGKSHMIVPLDLSTPTPKVDPCKLPQLKELSICDGGL